MNSDRPMPTVLFAGGGTGGHLYPGIAVAEELMRRETARCVFAGSDRPFECELLSRHGFEHHPLPAVSTARWKSRPIQFIRNNAKAFRAARAILSNRSVAAVVGLGGFASVPVALAAWRLAIPLVLLEQNVVPGRATRLLCRFATKICVTYASTASHLRIGLPLEVTGNPVRQAVVDQAANAPPIEQRQTLLVLGGSLGARSLNEAAPPMISALARENPTWTFLHQTGSAQSGVDHGSEESPDNVTFEPFIDDLPHWLSRAGLVVSRAGGTTISELLCGGCPSILVPFPHALGDHQSANASEVRARGGAVVVTEQPADTFPSRLDAAVRSLLDDLDQRRTMHTAARAQAEPDAAANVAAVVERVMSATENVE